MARMTGETKRCCRCGETKALSEFNRMTATRDGLNPWCRQCCSAYNAKWRADNHEQSRERTMTWRTEHSDRVKEANTSKEHTEASVAWQKANPEKHCARQHRRRALKAAAPGAHTADDTKALYGAQGGRCVYCGCDVSQGYHVDHIVPLSRGGSNAPDNLALACAHCNISKGSKLLSEWRPELS